MEQNRINITIAGKSYQLAGQESHEYLEKIASYIEGKYEEFGQDISFRTQSLDKQNLMMQINIADDYFKSKEQTSVYVRQTAEKDAEIRQLEQKLADMKIKFDNSQSDVKKLEKSNQTLKKRMMEMDRMLAAYEAAMKEAQEKEQTMQESGAVQEDGQARQKKKRDPADALSAETFGVGEAVQQELSFDD